MLTIKILGSGCANCKKLEAVAREAAASAGVEAEFVKVTDMKAIMAYDLIFDTGAGHRREAGEQRADSHAGGNPGVADPVKAFVPPQRAGLC